MEYNLDKKKESQLKEIYENLNSFEGNLNSESYLELEKEVAQFCLELIQNSPKNEEYIQNMSSVIANFIDYDFDSILEGAFDIAGELASPKGNIQRDFFYKWEGMGKLFKEYLFG